MPPVTRNRILMLVDHPNLVGMEQDFDRIIKPARLMDLARARGDVIHAVMFSDVARVDRMHDQREWEAAGFTVQYCTRFGRPIKTTGTRPAVGGRETVDNSLIEYAHRLIPNLVNLQEVILVTGDGDFVQFALTLVQKYRLSVRLFFTNRSILKHSAYVQGVYTEAYYLYDDPESRMEEETVPLFQRIMYHPQDRRTLTPKDLTDLNRVSEMLVTCPDCNMEVPIGLWKAHPCHPNAPVMEPPADIPSADLSPDPVAEAAHANAEALLRIQRLDPEWYGARERELVQIPRTGYEQIMTAIRRMPSELALCWLTSAESMTHTSDEIAALRRLVERGESKAVFAWQQVLKRLFVEFAAEGGVKALDAEARLAEWAGAYFFPNALPLLVHHKVLLVRQGLLVRRLTHPVCDYTPFAPTGAPHAA